MKSNKLVDLFSGTGGFSLGAHQAGYDVAVAVDNDPILSSSYAYNFPKTKLLIRDIMDLRGDDIVQMASGNIEGVFGGPPCQGFSLIGRKDNSDPRRKLLGHFFRLVLEIAPDFFIMENVKGLVCSKDRFVLENALSMVKKDYNIMGPHVFDAADFGAATRRQRVFVIGFRNDMNIILHADDIEKEHRHSSTVREAIQDLQEATEIGESNGFDMWRLQSDVSISDYAKKLRSKNRIFTGHRITQHSLEVIERFQTVPPGSIDKIGRHYRLTWEGQCPTLRAGTGSDKGSYQSVRPLHPDEPRVITVREAARLQGFPDSHFFHPTIWHSFRMIGNSVSPIISRAIFSAIRNACNSHI